MYLQLIDFWYELMRPATISTFLNISRVPQLGAGFKKQRRDKKVSV